LSPGAFREARPANAWDSSQHRAESQPVNIWESQAAYQEGIRPGQPDQFQQMVPMVQQVQQGTLNSYPDGRPSAPVRATTSNQSVPEADDGNMYGQRYNQDIWRSSHSRERSPVATVNAVPMPMANGMVTGADMNHGGIPDIYQQETAPLMQTRQAPHPGQLDPFNRDAFPTLLGSGTAGQRDAATLSPWLKQLMQQNRYLVHLMAEAFNDKPIEIKPKKTPFNIGVLDGIYHLCGFGSKSQGEMEKSGIDTEIKHLYERRAACGQLLDKIEAEVLSIEKAIEDRRDRRHRVMASLGAGSGMNLMNCCSSSPCCDEVEDTDKRVSGHAAGQVDLRIHLRDRLEEVELSLKERESELYQLKHEMKTQSEVANVRAPEGIETMPLSEKDIKEKMIRHYASLWTGHQNKGDLLKLSFYGWKSVGTDKKKHDKVAKMAAMGLFNSSRKGTLAVCFSSWHAAQRETKNREHAKQQNRMKYYASRFAQSSSSASVQVIFYEWWKLCKDSKAQDYLEDVRKKAERDAKDAMEARHAVNISHFMQDYNFSAMVHILAGKGLTAKEHTLYCVCEIPGKPESKFQTKAVKSHRSNDAMPSYELRWDFKDQMVKKFEAADELLFTVKVEGSTLSHLFHSDGTLGTYSLKPSQFFPKGFEDWVTLVPKDASQKQPLKSDPVPQIQIKVEIQSQKVAQPAPSPSGDHPSSVLQSHAESAAASAKKAEEAAELARKAASKQPGCTISCAIQ
jgi:hypothetical protein